MQLELLGKKTILVIIITISLYVGLVIFSDISSLSEKFQSFDYRYLSFALVLVFISYIIRGIRYNLLLKKIDVFLPLKKSVVLFFAGLGFGITPGKFGEIIKSSFLKKQYGYPLSKTIPVVFVERYFDLIGIIIMMLFGIMFIDFEKTILIPLFVLVILILLISKQRNIVISLLRKIKTIPFLNRFTENFLEQFPHCIII